MTEEPSLPIYFDSSSFRASTSVRDVKLRDLAGKLHKPRDGGRRPSAAVLCSPFGPEPNYIFRAYRQIAERLAISGLCALRFDYHATGNSPGDEREPGVVRAWLDSIHAALDFVIGEVGANEIFLFGTRLGATLAVAAAAERNPGEIKGMALWSPFARGCEYTNEILFAQRLTSKSVGEKAPTQESDGSREVTGFVLTPATLDALRKLDLAKIAKAPADAVLVLGRRESLPETALVERLRSLGVQTEHEFVPGLAETMISPDQAVPPTAVIDRVSSWIVSHRAPAGDSPPSADASEPRQLISQRSKQSIDLESVRESSIRFGRQNALFGIVSESIRKPETDNRLGIVFINPGAVDCTGPTRLNVVLARYCADLGYPAMRFDFSGVGDSAVNDDTEELDISMRQKVLKREREGVIGEDVHAALDVLAERCGVERFVLFGMCSAARMAFHAAIHDTRVVGALLINAPFFDVGDGLRAERQAHTTLTGYRKRLFLRNTWVKLFKGELDFARALRAVQMRGGVLAKYWVTKAGKSAPLSAERDAGAKTNASSILREVGRGFGVLVKRGVSPLLLYSPGDEGIDYVGRELGVTLQSLGLTVEILLGADHDMNRPHARAQLIALLSSQLRELGGLGTRSKGGLRLVQEMAASQSYLPRYPRRR